MGKETSMSSDEFRWWLEGFLARKERLTEADTKYLREQLKSVDRPESDPVRSWPIMTTCSVG
jgi:hypothetical protein